MPLVQPYAVAVSETESRDAVGEDDPDGSGAAQDAGAAHDTGTAHDTGIVGVPGWTNVKVAGLVAVAGFVAVLLALTLQSRFDGEAEDSVDVGFMRDMISHHEQAIQLGLLGVANAQDPDVVRFAQETVIAQQWEIGYMTALLEDWGYDTGSVDRDAMVWMGMPGAVEDMPGMASADEMDSLRTAQGDEADALFLQLMARHHVGGQHMTADAAEHAGDPRVRELAARMGRNQRGEVIEYQRRADALGVQLDLD